MTKSHSKYNYIHLRYYMDFLCAQLVKNLAAMWET